MSGEFRPLNEILRELGPLARRKASGFFFVVTEDNHSCTIRLRNGDIDDVAFSRQRNDEAVRLLSAVRAARARFQPMAVSAANSRGTLSEESLKWLLGDAESLPAALETDSAMAPPAAGVSDARRAIVEKIALNYVGPIASLLCDEAFVAHRDIGQALAQIGSNLSSSDESRRFMAEVRGAIARVP